MTEAEMDARVDAAVNAAVEHGYATLRRERLFAAFEALDAAARLDDTDADWPTVFRSVSRMLDEARAAERVTAARLAAA